MDRIVGWPCVRRRARLVQVLKPVSDGLPHPGRWAILWLEGRVVRVGWWPEPVGWNAGLAGDVLGEVALWGGIVVVLNVVLWGWELGSQNVDPAAECG